MDGEFGDCRRIRKKSMKIFNPIRIFNRARFAAYIDPVRDWLILLTLSTFAFISIIVWNIWAFDTVARGGVIGVAETSAPATFDSSSVEVVQKVFLKRASEEMKYVTGVYRYADPSQ